jgi:hypothetical protein
MKAGVWMVVALMGAMAGNVVSAENNSTPQAQYRQIDSISMHGLKAIEAAIDQVHPGYSFVRVLVLEDEKFVYVLFSGDENFRGRGSSKSHSSYEVQLTKKELKVVRHYFSR